MTTDQRTLTLSDATRLVQKALGLSWSDAYEWLKRAFSGRASGMTRAALEEKVKKTLEAWRKMGLYPTPPNDGREDDEPSFSL